MVLRNAGMKFYLITGFYLLFFFSGIQLARSQYGYSEFAESVITGVTDSSLALTDRQLSGDTSVFIGGVLDSLKTRNSNNIGNAKAAQFILEKFQSFGLDAGYQHYAINGYNVIATKTGTVYPNEQYIICAHYDDMPTGALAPGADDNGSGTSAVLEAARVLSPYSFDYTIKFIAFDEEEQGLIGSLAYADTAFKYGAVIRGVLNMDMIGWDSNNDYEFSVGSNDASMPLLGDFTDILRIFQPVLSPHLIIATNSDHSRFWNRGYQALLAIEEYPGDFLPYYHTTNDLFQYINRPFFLAMTRGAIAAIATMGRNYKMYMSHQPAGSNRNTGNRTVSLKLTSPHLVDTVEYKPRLYYKIDEGDFNFINAFQVSGDTFKFSIPGQLPGNKISYYFAARDVEGEYSVTLPESGKNINPPGSIPPPVFYSYYILKDTVATTCATGLPMTIPGNQIVNKVVNIPYSGQLLDVNVKVSINHTYDKDINLYLVSPSGREVMLSTKNGISLDNYTNTVFDDEAVTFINQGRPPYSGTYRPEQPLSLFDDTVTSGNWSLKIRNAGSTNGTLTSFCLILTFANNDLYVDASRPVSGNGRSWATAFRSISEAASKEPPAGSVVFIKPGIYDEEVVITSNGQDLIPLKTGISLSDGSKIQFPAGTNLSGINLVNFPGEYYACIFRSRNSNNGYYQVKQVNDAGDYVVVNWQSFKDENGITGDSSSLSALVCRPVIYSKYSLEPGTERVTVDAGSDESTKSVLYIGEAIGDGSYDALPADYNIIDGIDVTGSVNGEGVHIQSSSFNIITNGRIFETGGPGILVDGNADHPANFNYIINNEIYNTTGQCLYVGAGGMPVFNNHTHYNHLVGNDIHAAGDGSNAQLENAITIYEDNSGTLLERNLMHDFNLVISGKGALDIGSGNNKTIVNGNIFKNIGKTGEGTYALIMVHDHISELDIFNNLLYDSLAVDNDLYAFRIDGTGHDSSRIVHNTIYNIDRGFLLEDYATEPAFVIINNIIHINDLYFTHFGSPGRFGFSHNLYPADPAPQPWMPYFNEEGRQIGEVAFNNPSAGDFHLASGDDLAICNGLNLPSPFLYDASLNKRYTELPDIGAFELEHKIVWTGLTDQNWSTPANWSLNALPGSISNVVIQPASFSPYVDIDHIMINGILLKPGSSLTIPQNNTLEQQ
jgi:subtilisin-like proprotein convertase family protein